MNEDIETQTRDIIKKIKFNRRKSRFYSEDFKKQIVLKLTQKQATLHTLAKQNDISPSVIKNWQEKINKGEELKSNVIENKPITRRHFPDSFKHKILSKFNNGEKIADLSKQYKINGNLIHQWKRSKLDSIEPIKENKKKYNYYIKKADRAENNISKINNKIEKIEINFCPTCGLDLLKLGTTMSAMQNI